MMTRKHSGIPISWVIWLAMCVILPSQAKADVVTDWNQRTVQYSAAAGRPGPSFIIDIAVVQAAVYDAVQAIEGEYQPYCGSIPGASGSIAAAAATAARDVLVHRFQAQAPAINADYNLYVMGIDPADPGFAVGHAAAACMNALRANDGAFPNPPWPPFIGGTGPGEWRPAPPGNAPLAAEWLGFVTPFTMRTSDQFRAGPPPKLTSPEYTRAYNEAKLYGSANSTSRSVLQTDIGHFWNSNIPAMFNKLARDLAIANDLDVSESSRLITLSALVMADSGIASWDSKRYYNFWRPITAIREGNADGNPQTVGDPNWIPLGNTPPYPDHTSGANALSGAAMRAFSLYFETNAMEFSITTTNLGPTSEDTRHYRSFAQVRDEVVDARIYLGYHFRFADQDARKQGEHIAQWANAHYFRPID